MLVMMMIVLGMLVIVDDLVCQFATFLSIYGVGRNFGP